jgi:transposase
MLKIAFTENEILALHYERFHHPHPRIRLKMEVLWLKSQGLSHKEIARLTCIGQTTLRCYIKEYISGGISRLKQLTFYRPSSKLLAHQEKIKLYFQEFPPTTIKEAAAKIEELTGIKRGQTQTRQFLTMMGMRCLKVGMVPGKADFEQQAEFKKKS